MQAFPGMRKVLVHLLQAFMGQRGHPDFCRQVFFPTRHAQDLAQGQLGKYQLEIYLLISWSKIQLPSKCFTFHLGIV